MGNYPGEGPYLPLIVSTFEAGKYSLLEMCAG